MTSERIVAVTGGTQGIGRAVADLFSARNYKVAVCSRSRQDTSFPDQIIHYSADVRKRDDMQAFVAGVIERFGRLDVVVNNAGFSRWKRIEDVDEDFVTEVLQ